MTFYHKTDIILCRLLSHTFYKLQPCDIRVFDPLKMAYREQVKQLYRGGADTIGKQHFTLFYSRARAVTFTRRNIQSCRSKPGLFPFNPDRVLGEIQEPQEGTDDLRAASTLNFAVKVPDDVSNELIGWSMWHIRIGPRQSMT
jgi:hypothetical protein